jgi:hypothetical protein
MFSIFFKVPHVIAASAAIFSLSAVGAAADDSFAVRDIAGVEFGMTPAEAFAVLEAQGYDTQYRDGFAWLHDFENGQYEIGKTYAFQTEGTLEGSPIVKLYVFRTTDQDGQELIAQVSETVEYIPSQAFDKIYDPVLETIGDVEPNCHVVEGAVTIDAYWSNADWSQDVDTQKTEGIEMNCVMAQGDIVANAYAMSTWKDNIADKWLLVATQRGMEDNSIQSIVRVLSDSVAITESYEAGQETSDIIGDIAPVR